MICRGNFGNQALFLTAVDRHLQQMYLLFQVPFAGMNFLSHMLENPSQLPQLAGMLNQIVQTIQIEGLGFNRCCCCSQAFYLLQVKDFLVSEVLSLQIGSNPGF